MHRRLWVKFFFLLLAVSAIALSAALLLREFMVRDFREYLEGEAEDRVYWLTAAAESTYEKYGGWERQRVIDDLVWALMLGFVVRVHDVHGELVMDTDQAVEALSPVIRRRVMAVTESRRQSSPHASAPYDLFLRGEKIGRLEVSFLRPEKEKVFVRRSNLLLMLSVIALGGIGVVVSIVFARTMTRPITALTDAVAAISDGHLSRRVPLSRQDEIGRLSFAFNRMAESLEIQESLRRKLSANVAHELRTPISAIRAELEAMMDGFIPLDRETLKSLSAEIRRLGTILDGIEELTQAEASGLNLRKENIELKPLLRDIVERYRVVSRGTGIAISLDCDEGVVCRADPDRLSQMVINLLSNALRATAAGGSIRVRGFREDGETVVEVADTGRGIREEDMPFIFERFYRGSDGGLGLGLAIVREIITAHGGRVSAESTVGKGSHFSLHFPLEAEPHGN